MPIRTSPRSAGIAVAALVATAAPVTPAAAADSGPVAFADTPSVVQAARAYPYLSGGIRDGHREAGVIGPVPGDCAETERVTRARGGVLVSYEPRPGRLVRSLPDVALSRFATPRRARAVLDRLRASYERCEGTYPGEIVRSGTPDPRLSPGSFGLRETYPAGDGTMAALVSVLTVQGSTLVRASAFKNGGNPSFDQVVALGRTAKGKVARRA